MTLVRMLKGACVSQDAFGLDYLTAGEDYELTDSAADRLVRIGAAEIIFCNVDWAVHKYMVGATNA